ncbi:MAG TPA: hypothetical protein VG248_13560 [Caulobacteraceae bacterium]|jgi:rod shape-determining protein MreD|nr:hypothetical protein [Caulobacteraceae bacterium]
MPAKPLVEPLNPVAWIVAPAAAAALVSLALATPLDFFGLRLPEPAVGMVCAFAWAVIRPSMLAPFALVALGLFEDLLWGTPLGLWPVALLAAYGATLAVRSAAAGEGFWARWAWYAGACAIGFAAAFLFRSGAAGAPVNLVAIGLQAVPTLLLFWFANRLIERFEDADVRFR